MKRQTKVITLTSEG